MFKNDPGVWLKELLVARFFIPAMLNEFGFKVFQQPTGEELLALKKTI